MMTKKEIYPSIAFYADMKELAYDFCSQSQCLSCDYSLQVIDDVPYGCEDLNSFLIAHKGRVAPDCDSFTRFEQSADIEDALKILSQSQSIGNFDEGECVLSVSHTEGMGLGAQAI